MIKDHQVLFLLWWIGYNDGMEKLNGKWVVAVSGGADSMSLLDMCYRAGTDIICAHVDYNKRETSKRDALGVETYCKKRHIPFYKKVVENYPKKGNFQSIARDIRYEFFKELIDKYEANGVLVAHQLDDHLETYLMQKNRHSIPLYYGICEDVEIYNCHIKRLLLDYTKQDLIDYCNKHHLEYYDDESNFTNLYTRNKIRHEKIEKMTRKEKDALAIEIKRLNKKLEEVRKEADEYLNANEHLIISKLKKLDKKIRMTILRKYLSLHTDLRNITKKSLNVLDELILSDKDTFVFEINDYEITGAYDMILIDIKASEDYNYTINRSDELIETKYFKLSDKGELIQMFSVNDDDFPLTIRNAQDGDKIKLRIGTKRVSRFFIDRKITKKERKLWPVVENSRHEIIYVYGLGCDINHFSNNLKMFMIK